MHYKLAGVRMLVHGMTGNYPRPIPASIVDLRPAIETCGNCHNRHARSASGRASSANMPTTRRTRRRRPSCRCTWAGRDSRHARRAIHWHADPAMRVEYVATDAERADDSLRAGDQRPGAGQGIRRRRHEAGGPANGVTPRRWTASTATTPRRIRSRRRRNRPWIAPSRLRRSAGPALRAPRGSSTGQGPVRQRGAAWARSRGSARFYQAGQAHQQRSASSRRFAAFKGSIAATSSPR